MTVIDLQKPKPITALDAKLSCDVVLWRCMLELGRAFGWRPRGAPYVAHTKKSEPGTDSLLRHDYEPGSAQDAKRLDEDDAAAWANALSAARSSQHLYNMTAAYRSAITGTETPTSEESQRAHAELLAALGAFIAYLRSGEFNFSIREETSE